MNVHSFIKERLRQYPGPEISGRPKRMKAVFIILAGLLAILRPSVSHSADHPDYVRIPLNEISVNLSPGVTADMLSTEIQTQLFVGLTQYDPKTLKPRPYLAERWKTSRDMREYVFYLRKDVKWTNGDPVTAHDLIWSIRRNILPETDSEIAYLLYILENGEEIHKKKITNITKLGAHLIDDYTIIFNLKYPASYFPSMVAYTPFWPLPRKTIARHGKNWTHPNNIVTNGPYLLSEIWEDEEVIILEANPLYFETARVGIPSIHYMRIDSGKALTMYTENEIDILGGPYLPIPLDDILFFKWSPDFKGQYSTHPSLCTYYWGFNNDKPPTDDPLVRKAISAAINRKWIVDAVTRGGEEPAYTFTRPPIFGSVDPRENVGIRYNPELAKKWLAKAGYKNGRDFPELVMIYNTDDFHEKIAKDIQHQLERNLGIKIKITPLPWEEFMNEFSKPSLDAHLFRWGWCADYPDANNWLMENFHHEKSPNKIRWRNDEFASLVDKAQKITDTFTRIRLYKKAERILCEDEAAIIPLFYYTSPVLVKPWLDAKIWPILGNQIRTWSFKE